MKHAAEISKMLENVQKEAVKSIESFFRHSDAGTRLNLNNTFASNENENIEINGIAKNEEEIYIYGEDQYGEGKSAAIEECSAENLIGILTQLEKKAYTEDHD